MVAKKITLDTNAYSRLLAGDKRVISLIEYAEEIIIPVIVIGELLYGFKNGNQYIKNIEFLSELLKKTEVFIHHTTMSTAELFSDIKMNLKQKGKPIPTNDIWIAAIAMENGSVLLSYDQHFEHISGLRVIS